MFLHFVSLRTMRSVLAKHVCPVQVPSASLTALHSFDNGYDPNPESSQRPTHTPIPIDGDNLEHRNHQESMEEERNSWMS